jgi:hypothetical protein
VSAAVTAVATLTTATFVSAQGRTDQLPIVFVDDDGRGAAFQLLSEGAGAPPLGVRLVVTPDALADVGRLPPTNDRVPLWLVVPAPAARESLETWRAAVRRLVERTSNSLGVLEIDVDAQPADVVEFAVKLAATEVRARRETLRVALGGPAMEDATRRAASYSAALAPYVDLLALSEARRAGVAEWLQQVDPEAKVVLVGRAVPDGADARAAVVEAVVEDLGTEVVAHAWRVSALSPAVLRALGTLSGFTSHELSALDAGAVGLRLTMNGAAPPAGLHSRLLFDTVTFSTLLVYWGEPSSEPLSISLHVPLAGTPSVTDLIDGTKSSALAYTRDDAAETSSVRVPLGPHPMLIDFSEGVAVVGEQSGVSAERLLSVGEIIARHRRQQLAQDRLVRNYIADARMRQFFRAQLTDAGYDVVIENRYFVEENDIEWEQRSFAVNNRHWEINQPFPMLQPEKVFALPLQLRFDEGYTYRLEGVERVDGRDCYKVRFDPMRDDPSLYRGTVWIDRRTFARIQLHAVQGGLPGMVISNDETQHFAAVGNIENQPIFLLTRVSNREIMLLAGRSIPFEKTVTFGGFRLNDPGFDDERTAARQSDRVMYRETENGLRPYVKQNGTRVVVDQQTPGVKAMALGTVIDPSYRFPLPIFGINIVDFNFGNRNTQLAMLFAGVLAAGNIQKPQLFGSKNVSASIDFFAIAAPSSDRVYLADGEIESARLNTWPLSTGLNLGWQATPFQKLSAQYQFRFDGYAPDTTTSETFERPSSTVTNGIGGQWEYARNGYSVVLNAAWFARASWRRWGDPDTGTLVTTSPTYAKYQATISRDFLFSVFQKVNVNAAWFGGRDLDRFVQYQFGLFDATRIHGVPGAVRFGEVAMARGSYSLNVFSQYRLDLFLDYAWGRDRRGDDWSRIPGIGTAFNLPGPWNTIVRADVGKSWLPDRYGTLGSTVAQVMLLKPLR